MGRLTSKRTVLLLVLLAAGVLLVSGSRVWVNGSVDDPVLGASILHGTGSQVARGVLAAALVGAAAVVAAATWAASCAGWPRPSSSSPVPWARR